ncbi:methionyl-tRNA formyltransferase [Clostridium frigidicarnis]|uniref:Methionyl-tRNA formyltransferase n=1 Tax=Clostridium frigidicarnis TaxID=84698 RepID=A0A1I0ZMQ7_9CLOT|nr:methionyl-tRNA formyltransferase [Clostridium frigidicarnis]SFB26781.1 methionyl-tRNA formyltransferase [Clostridium frigidicarnis]
MKVVFMGTPEFAVPSLEILVEKFNVEAVFTQPDRPKGRGKRLAISQVKEIALKHNIPVYQPIKLKNDEECINVLKNLQPDYIVVVAFGQILSKEVLDIPKYGCVNLHASLLPKFRGAAPINYAVMMGEKVSGNTTMLMDIGLDTGDILLKDQCDIHENMTAGELHDKLMARGGDLLVKTLEDYAKGHIVPVKQGDESTYASLLNKEMAKIDWNKSAKEIHNHVRGLNPWPVAYTFYKDQSMKIYESSILSKSSKEAPGTILDVNKDGIEVATGDGVILIKIIQFPNGKPLKIEQYINGHSIDIKEILA